MDIRARKTKSFQNLRFRNDFNIKTSKSQWFFKKKCPNFIPRALSDSHKTNGFSTFMLHKLARATFSCSYIIKFQHPLQKKVKWTFARARPTKNTTISGTCPKNVTNSALSVSLSVCSLSLSLSVCVMYCMSQLQDAGHTRAPNK